MTLQILTDISETVDGYGISCCIVKLKKSYLIFITDDDNYEIGNVMLAVPPVLEGVRGISSAAPAFGFKHDLVTKLVAERCASKLNKPCMVFVYIRGIKKKEKFIIKTVVKVLDKALSSLKTE